MFTDDADFVVLYLDMGPEGEVQLSLPRAYLEDRADQQSGLRHGSLFLRMMVGSALPVSREQALRLSATQQDASGKTAFISILISDFPDLVTQRMPPPPHSAPDKLGLIPITNSNSMSHTIYFALHPDGFPRALIECSAPETARRQSCTHQIRTSGVDVVLDYNADLLANWEGIQTRVERFLECATEG